MKLVLRLLKVKVFKLSGYGNFVLRDKTSRVGRNPKTGEEKIVSERRVVIFRPGQKLKDRVKDYVHRNPEE